MHALHLVELAGVISTHSNLISDHRSEKTSISIEKYWAASKCRTDRWSRSLRMFEHDLSLQDPNFTPWPAIEATVIEILFSEMLARVWTACGLLHDEKSGDDSFCPICRSILIGQLEARSRVLRILVKGDKENHPTAQKLNEIRKKIERWTDLLLARLPQLLDPTLAFDAERV